MIFLHRGENAEQRIKALIQGASGDVVERKPTESMTEFAAGLAANIVESKDPELAVIFDASVDSDHDVEALQAITRVVKFSGVDLLLTGSPKLERFVDRIVTDDEPTDAQIDPETEVITEFEQAPVNIPSVEEIKKMSGWSDEKAKQHQAMIKTHKVWVNNLYQVNVEPVIDKPMVHLIIRRRDGKPIHNWRHFQSIKNQIVGEECEAVEMYPAESHLVDAKDHYHLWAFTSASDSFNVGFKHGREVKD